MSHQACPNRRRIVRLLPSRVRLHRPRRRSLDGPPFARVSLLVFVVGASSLGTEIAAARLLAPYFGASTIVWANTIAIVLVALSLGYWIGGLLARGQPTYRLLCLVTLLAGVGLATVPFVARPFLNVWVNALAALDAGAFIGSLLGVLVLVAVPVLLLGIAAPLAIRLTVATVEESGSKAGPIRHLDAWIVVGHIFVSAAPDSVRGHPPNVPGIRARAEPHRYHRAAAPISPRTTRRRAGAAGPPGAYQARGGR
jgi:hypothetical protein